MARMKSLDCVYSKCRFPYSLISCDINLVNMELTIGQKILPSREIWYPLISNQHSFDGINFSSSVEIIKESIVATFWQTDKGFYIFFLFVLIKRPVQDGNLPAKSVTKWMFLKHLFIKGKESYYNSSKVLGVSKWLEWDFTKRRSMEKNEGPTWPCYCNSSYKPVFVVISITITLWEPFYI